MIIYLCIFQLFMLDECGERKGDKLHGRFLCMGAITCFVLVGVSLTHIYCNYVDNVIYIYYLCILCFKKGQINMFWVLNSMNFDRLVPKHSWSLWPKKEGHHYINISFLLFLPLVHKTAAHQNPSHTKDRVQLNVLIFCTTCAFAHSRATQDHLPMILKK